VGGASLTFYIHDDSFVAENNGGWRLSLGEAPACAPSVERLPAEVAAEDCDVQLGIAALAALFMVRTPLTPARQQERGLTCGLRRGGGRRRRWRMRGWRRARPRCCGWPTMSFRRSMNHTSPITSELSAAGAGERDGERLGGHNRRCMKRVVAIRPGITSHSRRKATNQQPLSPPPRSPSSTHPGLRVDPVGQLLAAMALDLEHRHQLRERDVVVAVRVRRREELVERALAHELHR